MGAPQIFRLPITLDEWREENISQKENSAERTNNFFNDRMQCDICIWEQLAAGRSLINAFRRGGCGERSCPRSATASHSVAVDRTPNLAIV